MPLGCLARQTTLATLASVYAALHAKLHYTHINTSLRDNVVNLENRLKEQQETLDSLAKQHAIEIDRATSAVQTRMDRKQVELTQACVDKIRAKKVEWAEKEQASLIETNQLKAKVKQLNEEKRTLELSVRYDGHLKSRVLPSDCPLTLPCPFQ